MIDDKNVSLLLAEKALTKTKIEVLKNALHEISLCSQNSMSSKEECGRIARKALQMIV